MDYETFLQGFKALRTSANLSQRSFAKKIDKSAQYVSLIESGKLAMRVEDYLYFCQVLGVYPSALFENHTQTAQALGIEQYGASISERDLHILKDLALLMSLNKEDL